MKLSTYNEIIEFMQIQNPRECVKLAVDFFPGVPQKTLGSIYAQDYQRKVKKCHHKFNNSKMRERLYQRYTEEVKSGASRVLVTMADQFDFSPALLARIVLEQHFQVSVPEDEMPTRNQVSGMLKDTSLIPDPILAKEVHMSILSDSVYGCVVDTIKHGSIGQEYEYILQRKVEEKKLAYLEEDQLRARGYDKTPDCKLEVPIAVDGHVVNWIESKASFGDEESHRSYLKDQFWSYWNSLKLIVSHSYDGIECTSYVLPNLSLGRIIPFGPGLVIYWFGFIEELDTNRDKGIMIMDHFPENIVVMNPLALTAR